MLNVADCVYDTHLASKNPKSGDHVADHMHIIVFWTFLRSSRLFVLLCLTMAPLLGETIYVCVM